MIASLQEIDIDKMIDRKFTASPAAWEDQVLYFLLIDRFSDNNEFGFVPNGQTALFQTADNGNAVANEADAIAWKTAGDNYVNGNIRGITNKLSYLKNLGITALWISPVFKQVSFQATYHGYGIQDFLEVNPHFGTKEDLRELVNEAHALGIYVILDIILNHTGNVFSYNPDRYLTTDNNGYTYVQARWDDRSYAVRGFTDATGVPSIDFTNAAACGPDEAIWPIEFRQPDHFTQKGQIINFDYDPEYLQGDFFDMKDIHLGVGPADSFTASKALLDLIEIYKYWIALLDIDGYRIDTVKHMETGAVRLFVSAMHEFTQTIGKENFYLIGEITGDRNFAYTKLEETGIDAALGIADVQLMLADTIKGKINPVGYFDLFRNSMQLQKDSHTWFRNKVVVMIDDHDKVSQGQHKSRFCALDDGDKLIINAIAANLTTLGIPCIYYGTEQCFDGQGDGDGADRYLRESMFGGGFGAFRSREKHFFNVENPVYREVGKINTLLNKYIALRRGRQYLREISGDDQHFGLPSFMDDSGKLNTIIAWSRIIDTEEIVVAMNTDTTNDLSVSVTIEAGLHQPGEIYTVVYPDNVFINDAVVKDLNGRSIKITVPAAGFVIMVKKANDIS